ncbi:Citrate synthase-like protein [Candidatus Omnitrophus magneticus]|uniref:Citrate synthase n=1 Tax=Candidatus Omnitrophus magneticus TaxID=1609969 RepID=A0A0F0CVD5_9BACT|nr:Citrate synthase-like protein [Candidatus Omnitrophus magneticus]
MIEQNSKNINIHEITRLILAAKEKAMKETESTPEPGLTGLIKWPVTCLVGPGLEGAISCETKVGYVNGAKGWLIYRGYDIFDLCAYSTFEEVSYLLLFGELPSKEALDVFKKKLIDYRSIINTQRFLMSFALEEMNTMAAMRMGVNFMRQEFSYKGARAENKVVIGSDEDSIAMETTPRGEERAIYEFAREEDEKERELEMCYHLIGGVPAIAATISRIRNGKLPIEPDPSLSHSANFLYMMTGIRPTPLEERIMDVCLILHADHGMNASTFAAMVVASTLSDFYFSIGSGIAALNGPLHGGANEQVMNMLKEISSPENVKSWLQDKIDKKARVMGFGHRVYKAYDPRARVLGPLAEYLASFSDAETQKLFQTAKVLEQEVITAFGAKKGIFPNVDFYSGIVYSCLGIQAELFTPIFAVSRVAGWTSRVLEYLKNNRIFRPRAMYVGDFAKE